MSILTKRDRDRRRLFEVPEEFCIRVGSVVACEDVFDPVMCIGSQARANVTASFIIQPGPQSRARPTSSPSTFFIASTQEIVLQAAFGHETAVRVRRSFARLVVPHAGNGAHHRGVVEAHGHLNEREAFFGFLLRRPRSSTRITRAGRS